MNLKEFSDYCLAITAQTAAEPTASPVLDADMIVEFLLPSVLREATRNAFRKNRFLETLIKPHRLMLSDGSADLASGLEEEFVRSFQIGQHDTFVRAISGTYNRATNIFTASVVQTGSFDTDDVGRRMVLRTPDGEIYAEGLIGSIITIDSVELYATAGAGSTSVTAYIYDVTWTLARTVADVSGGIPIGDTTITVGELDSFFAEDVGRKAIVTVDLVDEVTSLIRTFPSSTEIELFYNPSSNVLGPTCRIYRRAADEPTKLGLFSHVPYYADFLRDTADILPKFCVQGGTLFAKNSNNAAFPNGTELTLYGVTVPQVPADETTNFDISETILDDALAITSALLKGERPLASVGLTVEKLQK